ncbi:MAG: PCRF domain-containing protein, partial [Alphaproteobacteria bacterium]|nr:PCRF domain-containing protein [Alphaproteobacteria bacterium]
MFDWDVAVTRLSELDALTQDQSLWDDPDRAQKLMQERTHLEKQLGEVKALERGVEDALMLVEMGEAEGDTATVTEAEAELEAIRATLEKMQIESLLSGEADGNDCYLEVHAGAGGTEAQDWAEMMLRMYLRWSDQHKFKAEIMAISSGEEAGVKSVEIRITGDNTYGLLKSERGVHRLVRISPFDSSHSRHTSFALVEVMPEAAAGDINVEIKSDDLRIDTYRASG